MRVTARGPRHPETWDLMLRLHNASLLPHFITSTRLQSSSSGLYGKSCKIQIISEEEYLGKSKVNREDKNKYTRGNWILWTLHLKQTLVQQIWLKKILKHANKQEKWTLKNKARIRIKFGYTQMLKLSGFNVTMINKE